MSGTVAVITDAAARYTQFYQCLTSLHKPPKTVIEFVMGSNRSRSRNELCQHALDRGSEWIFFVDDDQAFPNGILERMLSHEQPVVSALIVQRTAPFLPIAFAEKEDGKWWPLDLRSHGPNELIKVAGCGAGGLLIRSEALAAIGDPWFQQLAEKSEDLFFSDRCAEEGIPIYVDSSAHMGHIAPAVVFPSYIEEEGEESRWVAGIQFSYTTAVEIEMDHADYFKQDEDS